MYIKKKIACSIQALVRLLISKQNLSGVGKIIVHPHSERNKNNYSEKKTTASKSL
jgi:hypothetical protein